MGRPQFKTSSDVLRELNATIYSLKHDEISVPKGRAIIYACSTAGSLIRNIDIEKRLEQLEDLAEGGGKHL